MRRIIYLPTVKFGLQLDQNFIGIRFAILLFVMAFKQKKRKTTNCKNQIVVACCYESR